ncbi:hypothetical protein NMY22_g13276 [Coprinellus aureogranulatus]|nr:hypothetical protein NMY22_g13276 [Coprinellus aureogranulatus]
METLLTPSESLAFQSFLTTVDTSQPPNDWASYASQFSPNSIRRDDDDISVDPLPPPPENDTLAKATKDLMSLDTAGWNDGPMSAHPDLPQHLMYAPQLRHHQEQQQPLLTQPLHPQHMYSSPHESFPFLNQKGSFQQHNPSYPQQPNHTQHFSHPQHHPQHSLNLASPTTPDLFSYPPPHAQNHPNGTAPPLTRSQSQSSAHGINGTMPPKRPARSSATRSMSMSSASTSTVAPRQRAGTSASQQSRSSHSPHPNGATASSSKPALLSPSQKKANHIQSEQKRRANIRRGYEALCETVPALREAIREEEEEARLNAAQAAAGLTNAKGKSTGKKRAAKKKDGDDGAPSSARDKIDGRAGPRSENVVLSKSEYIHLPMANPSSPTCFSAIDYINDLLSERSNLLSRLQKARSMLPPGHPCLMPLSPTPIWEREWKGGEGRLGDEDADESEGDAEAEDDDDSSRGKLKERRKGGSVDGVGTAG